MSDGIPAPIVPEPAAPAAEAVAPETPALHESWTKALDDAGIPDLFRQESSPLVQQIRRQEAEANRKIEELSAARAPESWQQLIEQAGDQITPAQLVQAYNAGEQIRQDPFAFIDSYVNQIDQMVASGDLTAPEGWAAKYRAAIGGGATQAQAAAAADGFVNPEDEQLTALQQQVQQMQQRQQQQEQQVAEQQEEQAAEAYAEQFLNFLDTQLVGAGFAADVAGLDESTRSMVGSIAGQIIDASDGIDFDRAIPMAIQQVVATIAARGGQVAPRPAPTVPGLPVVGGGSNAIPAPAGQVTKEQKNAAMLAAAAEALQNS